MQRRSWIILAICVVLACGLFATILITQNAPAQLTQQQAIAMTQKMERSFEHKDASGLLRYIAPSPDVRISNITRDQLHLLLVRYFRNSDRVSAELKNYAFAEADGEATLQFDLVVHNDGPDSRKDDYSGRITLHLRRVDTPQLLGLYQTKEWRITSGETTGPDLSTFGD